MLAMLQKQLLEKRAKENVLAQIEIQKRKTAILCGASFHHFVRTFWSTIEPGQPFVDGWHIYEICKHLEACTEFKIFRLIVNIPPRHMKSILVSVMWPAWVWTKYPERRFIFSSYSATIALRDAVKCRTVIESPLYQELFKPKWSLRDDQNVKSKFENTKAGFRFATSTGGAITGEGADYIVEDDPLNMNESLSDTALEEARRFTMEVLPSRVNNPRRYSRILIMQRLHELDPCGHALKETRPGNIWERFVLPARYESKHAFPSKTSLEFKDPRTQDGALLWPERFDQEATDALAHDLKENSHAQMQQDPKAQSGNLFERVWWGTYDAAPTPILEIVQFWDCAQKPGISNDYSVCATWAKTQNGFYLLNILREKTTGPLLEELAHQQFNLYRPNAVVIEDKSAGSSLIQYLLGNTTFPVLPFNPTKDKQVRASAATPSVKAGKCKIPREAKWREEFLKEHEKFPKAAHDDQVDTTSMMIEYFNRRANSEPRVRSL